MGVIWIYFCSSQHMYKLCEFTLLCYYVKELKPHFYPGKTKQIISIILMNSNQNIIGSIS